MFRAAEEFRKVIHTKDIAEYRAKALALRREMLARDKNYPRYHFVQPEGWMNDPNGLIYFGGKYHVFCQYSPTTEEEGVFHAAPMSYEKRHRLMCWGHAVSGDLFHWQDMPVAMWPDTYHDQTGVFSGNTIIGPEGLPYAFYTGNVRDHDEQYGVCAKAQDRDLNAWEKQVVMDTPPYPGTTVHWDAQMWKRGDTYYQLIGGCRDGRGAANLFTSSDLEHWEFVSTVFDDPYGDYWELPYLLEFDGKYALLVGTMFKNMYWVGDFDYETLKFTPDHTEPLNADCGMYYSYNPSMVTPDGRRIMFGWVTGMYSPSGNVPYWQGLHSIPREIRLVNGVLSQCPAREIETLKTERLAVDASGSENLIPDAGGAYVFRFTLPAGSVTEDIRIELLTDHCDTPDEKRTPAEFLITPAGDVTFRGSETVTTPAMFDPALETKVQIFVDGSVTEIYAECDGISRAMTGRYFVGDHEVLTSVRITGAAMDEVVLEKIACIWE